jgi:hypothetical protein
MTPSAKLFSALVICGTFVPAIASGVPLSAAHVFDGEDGAPGLTSISPAGATAGHAALALVVNGSGFVSGSTIEWNGAGLSTIFVSSSQLQALIPMSDLSAAGAFSISVVNPSPGGASQNAETFTVGPAASAPYFTLAGGTYQSTQTLHLTDTTPGAVIHYTYAPTGSTPTTGSAVYDDGIKIDHSGLVEAIALAPGYSQSPISSKAYVYAPEPAAAAPYFSLAGGTYDTPQTLWLSDSTPGAVTYYSTDGSSPSAASIPYTGPITVSSTELVQAVAMATGYRPSSVSAKAYKFTTQPVASSPVFTLPGGTYSAPEMLMLTDSTPGVKIYYTTDGSSPADDGILYTGPITISGSELVMAVSVAPGYRTSPASAKLYNFVPAP